MQVRRRRIHANTGEVAGIVVEGEHVFQEDHQHVSNTLATRSQHISNTLATH